MVSNPKEGHQPRLTKGEEREKEVCERERERKMGKWERKWERKGMCRIIAE